jgi:hypothetical protein
VSVNELELLQRHKSRYNQARPPVLPEREDDAGD